MWPTNFVEGCRHRCRAATFLDSPQDFVRSITLLTPAPAAAAMDPLRHFMEINDAAGDVGLEGGRLRQHPEQRLFLIVTQLRMVQDASGIIVCALLLLGRDLQKFDG